jgi:hypothetical protein
VIKDKTIDEALIEIMRTKKALEALRKARKGVSTGDLNPSDQWEYRDQIKEHAAAKRASLDLTLKLADLRAGR